MVIIIEDIKSGLLIVKALFFIATYKWIELKTRILLERTGGNKSSKTI
jgi:hypothetical protein